MYSAKKKEKRKIQQMLIYLTIAHYLLFLLGLYFVGLGGRQSLFFSWPFALSKTKTEARFHGRSVASPKQQQLRYRHGDCHNYLRRRHIHGHGFECPTGR